MAGLGGLDGPRRAPAAGGRPQSLVILAHGYGSNGDDLIGLAPMLAKALPNTAFAAPDAPTAVPGYPDGFQWFPLTRLDPALMAAGARQAAPALERFVEAELRRWELPPSACALVGFSQGAMMSLHVGLRREAALAAVVAFSGVLTGPERLAAEVRSRPPVLLVHGARDEVLPVHALAAAREGLAQAGVGCRWRIEPQLAHSIGQAGLADCGEMLRAAFAARLAGWAAPQALPG